MSTHKYAGKTWLRSRRFLAFIISTLVFSQLLTAQPPTVPGPAEVIPAGSLIIPMDNFNQGNGAGTTFNLRAYGLANLMLQNDVPLKWAIKPGKSKDDTDFTANVTRLVGVNGVAGPADVAFSGGPFIIPAGFNEAFVTLLINNFNSGNPPVTVYKTTANMSADIRYTLTNKPKIAIGPDGGNFGTSVHENLFNSAGISSLYYTAVSNDIIDPDSCFTLATQAHSTNPANVQLYRQFVQGGGNLLLQCASIETFENNNDFGHFQTTALGYSVFGTTPNVGAVNTPLAYPEGSMPFNQFIGYLANQNGRVTEYAYAPGAGAANNNTVSVVNTGAHADKFVATVSQLGGGTGGVVFALGGHDYAREDVEGEGEIDTPLARLNGQRMILNAIFVPAQRPGSCSVSALVQGYKSVRRSNVRTGGLPIVPGDTLEWTIHYFNNSAVTVPNFQIKDQITEHLNYVPGSLVVDVSGGAFAIANPAYVGAGAGVGSDLLAPGGSLPPGGRVHVKINTSIKLTTPGGTALLNQTGATGTTFVGAVNSDNIDATNAGIFGSFGTPQAGTVSSGGSVPQLQLASIDPTRAIPAVTAAESSIEGSVVTAGGSGIANALVTVVNAQNGEVKSIRTNSFGFFRIEDLATNGLYLVTVSHKSYRFPTEPYTLTLSDNVTGLSFIGSRRGTKAGNN